MPEALKNVLRFLLIAAIALAAGFYFGKLWQTEEPQSEAAATLTNSAFADTQGQPARVKDWQGKLRIVNFWATWCAPCREELPLLGRFQQQHAAENLQILGIAIDTAESVAKFRQRTEIAFPVLIGNADSIPLMESLGNRAGGLPFSVFLDGKGEVLGTHLGPLNEKQLQDALNLLKRGPEQQK